MNSMINFIWKVFIVIPIIINILAASELNISLGEADVSDFPKICVDLSVKDSLGNVISELTSKNILILEDTLKNESVTVESIKDRGDKVSFLVAVDASRSMKGEPIDSIKSALANFIKGLSAGDKLGIITFHDNVEVISEFSDNKDSLIAQLDNIYAKGSITELYYGITTGLKKLSDTKGLSDNKVLIVLSDGKDEGTAYSDDDCIENAKERNIPIYSIGYNSSVQAKYLRVLERISDKTGGLYNDVLSPKKIKAMYSKVYNQVQGREILCFTTAIYEADSLEHNVAIKINKDGNSGEVELNFRSPDSSFQAQQKLTDWRIVAGIGAIFLLLVAIAVWRNKKAAAAEKSRLEEEKKKIDAEKEKKKKEEEKQKKNKEAKPKSPKKKIERKTIIAGRGDSTSICFNFETGPLKGTIEAIDGEITIGRSADNDLVIDDQTISGKHCKVTFENGQYFLTDLESTNGTSVNGEKISKIALSAGQTVELGKVKINVQ